MVQFQHHVVVGCRDGVQRAHRLATLRDARQQRHLRPKGHARQTAVEHPTGCALPGHVAIAAHGKLHVGGAAGAEAAKQVAGFGAVGHFLQQLGQIGRVSIGVDQGGLGHKTAGRVARQRCHAREHAVLVSGNVQQHHRQGWLIKILGVVGRHAHPHGAAPVGHLGQFAGQIVQQFARVIGVVVGDVQQAQRGRRGIGGQRHLCAQLRQNQRSRHAPLGMGGMASRKKSHSPPTLARRGKAGRPRPA